MLYTLNCLKIILKEVVMENLYNETLFIMKKYGITANKRLGQNFLIDEFVIE